MNSLSKRDAMKWIKALRSGEYTQGAFALQNSPNEYCCLGVACKLFIPKAKLGLNGKGFISGTIPNYEHQPYAPEWLVNVNISTFRLTGDCLSYLNDGTYIYRFTFDEIADVIQLIYVEGMYE